ncbi:MAG: hypothetical protein NC489_09095 [Ruminococcus flavefaciens]|nr:hypothetical protein [Ruminococcus flavefaciens]
MRIPHVHKLQYESAEKIPEETIEVHIDPQAYIDDIGLFEDKKEYVRWIIRVKQLIRGSIEYQELISFLKRRRGMNRCGIHPNISGWNGNRIELHHTPFVLEDLVSIVTKKHLDRNESLKMTSIIREIMEIHYLGIVGLYPLCTLCHALAHSESGDSLFIPLDKVFGEPEQFVDIYKPYMTEALYAKWANIQTLNKGYTIIQNNLPLELQRKYIYIENIPEGDTGELISTNKLAQFIRDL